VEQSSSGALPKPEAAKHAVLSDHCGEENGLSIIEAPEQWGRLVPKIEEMRGTVMIIGAPDSGKTTLARFLVRELCNRGESVAYIDGDMGQSVLGAPTTLGMAVFKGPFEDLEQTRPGGVYFVGSTSPRWHGLETVVGLKRLLERSQVDGDPIAIVDTTGYVTGSEALELKYQKMDLLDPRHIVALQRAREIEHILGTQEGRGRAVIHRLPFPPLVQRRSPEERRRYRWKRFKDYFRTVRLHRVDLRRTSLTGTHRLRTHGWPQEQQEGLLLGLNGPDNFLVALGITETMDLAKGVLSCLVPSAVDLERARSVRVGSIRIDLSQDADGERFVQ